MVHRFTTPRLRPADDALRHSAVDAGGVLRPRGVPAVQDQRGRPAVCEVSHLKPETQPSSCPGAQQNMYIYIYINGVQGTQERAILGIFAKTSDELNLPILLCNIRFHRIGWLGALWFCGVPGQGAVLRWGWTFTRCRSTASSSVSSAQKFKSSRAKNAPLG